MPASPQKLPIRGALGNPEVRAAYLVAYRAVGYHSQASRSVGVTDSAARGYRATHPDFKAACAAIDRERLAPLPRVQRRRPSAAMCAEFFTTLADRGSVEAAADRAGLSVPQVYKLRAHRADFATEWAVARNRALDRVEDRLFDGVLNGFTRTETVGEVVRTIVTQRPEIMFRLLETRRNAARPGVRTIDLTPELLASARAKIERQLRFAVASGSADAMVAALPMGMPAKPETPQSPAATVPAR